MHSSQQLLALIPLFCALVTAKPMMPIETSSITSSLSSLTSTASSLAATPSVIKVTSKPQIDLQNHPERAPFHTGLCTADLEQTDMSRGNFADYIEKEPHWKVRFPYLLSQETVIVITKAQNLARS